MAETTKNQLNSEFVHRSTLANGLEVLVHEMPWAGSVTAHLLVDASKADEPDDLLGGRHFGEHWLPDGTRNYTTFQLLEESIESKGGRQKETTDIENINYIAKVLPENTVDAVKFLSEIVLYPRLRKKDFARERKIIREELLTELDTPDEYIWTLICQQLWHNHPFSRGVSVFGTMKSVQEMNQQRLMEHHEKIYLPERLKLILAGRIHTDDALNLAEKIFGNTKPGKTYQNYDLLNSYSPQSKLLIEQKNLNQLKMRVGFTMKDLGVKKDAYLPTLVLDQLLGGKTYHQLISKLGLAYSAWTAPMLASNAGAVLFGSDADPEKTKIILSEFGKVLRHLPLTPEELNKAKSALKGRLTLGLADTNVLTEYIGDQLIKAGKVLSPDELRTAIDAITLEEVRQLKNRLFTQENVGVVLYGSAPKITEREVLSLLDLEASTVQN